MGRLFQYNRFGASDSVNKLKKDTQKKTHEKAKMVSICEGEKWANIKS